MNSFFWNDRIMMTSKFKLNFKHPMNAAIFEIIDPLHGCKIIRDRYDIIDRTGVTSYTKSNHTNL